MDGDFLDVLADWDGIGMITRYDEPTGSWMLVGLHDDTLGRPAGGCRMRVYERTVDALVDVTRLAAGMTAKWAAIGLPFGGGKAVLAVPRPLEGQDRVGLITRFGDLLNSLDGAFGTGEDLGTTPEDMSVLAERTPHVFCGGGDPGPYTAHGVRSGMRAAAAAVFGSRDLGGLRVLIQGVGDVGAPLARMLREEGASPLLSDLDEPRARALAAETGGEVIGPDGVYDVECDIYAPCAVGATVNGRTIPRLRCRAIVGSANNQLEVPEDATRLSERGILYAPDYVTNGGGAMAFGLMHHGVRGEDVLMERVGGIEAALVEIFEEAERDGVTPLEASDRRVRRILERGPGALKI